MLLALLPGTASAAETVDGGSYIVSGIRITWSLDSNGVLTIDGEGSIGNLIYDTYPWQNNMSKNYYLKGTVKKAVFLNGITNIGDNALRDIKSLTSVTIPASVTRIGKNAFAGCTGLTRAEYDGTEAQWKNMKIDASNKPLLSADIQFSVQPVNPQSTMTDPNTGESLTLDWDAENSAVSFSGGISSDAPVFAAVFDENEKMLSVVRVIEPETLCPVDLTGRNTARLFWLSAETSAPKAEAAILKDET